MLTQTPTQMLKIWFSMFSSHEIGSSKASYEIIFEALQSELFRFKFHSLSSKILKFPEFNRLMHDGWYEEFHLRAPFENLHFNLKFLKIVSKLHQNAFAYSCVSCPARRSMWAKVIQTVFQWKWFHYYEKIDSRFIIDQNRCIRYVVLWMIYVWNWCFIDFFIRSDFLRSKRSILKRQKTWWIKLQRRYCHIISQNWCLNLYFNLIRWSYTTNRC